MEPEPIAASAFCLVLGELFSSCAKENSLDIEAVYDNVLGGIDVYLNGVNGRNAWICVPNYSASGTVVFTDTDRTVTSVPLTRYHLNILKLFLLGK